MRNLTLQKKLAPFILAAILPIASVNADEICHQVSGNVKTKNIYFINEAGMPTQTGMQTGTIKFKLTDTSGAVLFNRSGDIFGQIVGFDPATFITTLNHAIVFDSGFLNTAGDVAVVQSIRAFDYTGNPCSFNIVESVTALANSGGFFDNVSHIDLTVEGYISFCLDEDNEIIENKNKFNTITGEICFD